MRRTHRRGGVLLGAVVGRFVRGRAAIGKACAFGQPRILGVRRWGDSLGGRSGIGATLDKDTMFAKTVVGVIVAFRGGRALGELGKQWTFGRRIGLRV
jgi:hypothetical protein